MTTLESKNLFATYLSTEKTVNRSMIFKQLILNGLLKWHFINFSPCTKAAKTSSLFSVERKEIFYTTVSKDCR